MEKVKTVLQKIYKVVPFVFIAIAVLCFTLSKQMTEVFPYLFSGVCLFTGVCTAVGGVLGVIKKGAQVIAYSYTVAFIAIGVVFLVKAQDIDVFFSVAIVWAITSIVKGGLQLGYGIEQAKRKDWLCLIDFAQAIFGITIGVLLLLSPTIESIEHHVILFGVEIAFTALTMIFGVEEEVSLWRLVDLDKAETPQAQSEKQEKKVA